MSDTYKAIIHIAFAILCALLASAEKTDMFWVVTFILASVSNAWMGIELFMGEDLF